MKNLLQILSILMLIAVFSSCTKTETEGFDDILMPTKAKVEQTNEVTEAKSYRPDSTNRSSGDLEDDTDGDAITDDDDDDDDDEGKSEVDK